MSKEEFNRIMAWFCEYHEKKMNKVQTEFWFKTFEKWPGSSYKAALEEQIQNDHFNGFPALGRIRGLLRGQYNKPVIKVGEGGMNEEAM